LLAFDRGGSFEHDMFGAPQPVPDINGFVV
jgi:hypothetical protein